MPVDIKLHGTMRRRSLVVLGDHLAELEHASGRDRVRRLRYDRIESVQVWRRMPWVRMLLVALLLGGPGVALLFSGETAFIVIGVLILVAVVMCELHYSYSGKVTIRITRAGRDYDFTGIIPPYRVNRFITRLSEGIRTTQAELGARARTRASEPLPQDI